MACWCLLFVNRRMALGVVASGDSIWWQGRYTVPWLSRQLQGVGAGLQEMPSLVALNCLKFFITLRLRLRFKWNQLWENSQLTIKFTGRRKITIHRVFLKGFAWGRCWVIKGAWALAVEGDLGQKLAGQPGPSWHGLLHRWAGLVISQMQEARCVHEQELWPTLQIKCRLRFCLPRDQGPGLGYWTKEVWWHSASQDWLLSCRGGDLRQKIRNTADRWHMCIKHSRFGLFLTLQSFHYQRAWTQTWLLTLPAALRGESLSYHAGLADLPDLPSAQLCFSQLILHIFYCIWWGQHILQQWCKYLGGICHKWPETSRGGSSGLCPSCGPSVHSSLSHTTATLQRWLEGCGTQAGHRQAFWDMA